MRRDDFFTRYEMRSRPVCLEYQRLRSRSERLQSAYHWLSPQQADSRRKFGCPICLPRTARIATPTGDVRIDHLHAGDAVFTADAARRRIVPRVRVVASTLAPPHHRLVRLRLSDGRRLAASPGHPTADGKPIADVSMGDTVDQARVVGREDIAFDDDATFDLLPEGDTGLYWADGVPSGARSYVELIARAEWGAG